MTLPPGLEIQIQQKASRAGLSMEAWLQQQVFRQDLEDDAPLAASLQMN